MSSSNTSKGSGGAPGEAGSSRGSDAAIQNTNPSTGVRGHTGAPHPGAKPGPLNAAHLRGRGAEQVPGTSQRSRIRSDSEAAAGLYTCQQCGKSYALKASLARHVKDCGSRDRTKCLHCNMAFATYPAVRQHERRAHPDAYRKELEQRLPTPESELMAKIAAIEATSRGGVIRYAEMQRATGLTSHQVRYRRESEAYKAYLESARREVRERGLRMFARPAPMASGTSSRSSGRPATVVGVGQTQAADINSASAPAAKRRRSDDGEGHGQVGVRGPGAAGLAAPGPARLRLLTPEPQLASSPGKRRLSSSPADKPAAIRRKGEDGPMAIARGSPMSSIQESIRRSPPKAGDAEHMPIREAEAVPPEPPLVVDADAVSIIVSSPPAGSSREHSHVSPRPSSHSSFTPEDVGRVKFLRWLTSARGRVGADTVRVIDSALTADDAALQGDLAGWLRSVLPARGRRRPGSAPLVRPRPEAPPKGGRGRAAEYKKAQDLFVKRRSELADLIFSGKRLLDRTVSPPIEEVDSHFRATFEADSPADDAPYIPATCEEVYEPVDEEQIRNAIQGWRNAAPGPDGVTVSQVKGLDPLMLAVLYNILLYRRITPTAWQESRTVLLPKGADRADPANWRPISIGAAAQRLLHRLLAKRLGRAVPGSPYQRGFREIDGTMANTLLLDHYIKYRRINGKAFSVVSLDIQKAFDTVSRHSVVRALARAGISADLISYIESTFDAHTTISVGGQSTGAIKMTRGVKQGDPLSCILFNLVVDELLEQLNSVRPGGTIAPGRRIAALAFADDVVLLEDAEVDMSISIRMTERFFADRGMKLNPRKSVAIVASAFDGKSVVRTKPIFKVGGVSIPMVTEMSAFRYLGLQFSATGSLKPTVGNLTFWLGNLERSPLKPDQKLDLLRVHLVPRLLYGLQTPAITGAVLAECSRLVRRSARRILHLARTTGNHFIHASLKDGGLGIADLRRLVPKVMSERIQKLRGADELTAAALETEPTAAFAARLARLAALGDPAPYWREQITSHPLSSGLEGVAEDKASRTWLVRRPVGWPARDFVRAVWLRTNNLPCLGTPGVATGSDRYCRHGCDRVESVAHVLQKCSSVHHERIARHDEIVAKIARHCRQKGHHVEVERTVRHPDGQRWRPDIAVHLSDRHVVICDVTVCWEGSRSLAQSWHDKRLIYDHPRFRDGAAVLWPGRTIDVLPVVLGARGIWPRANVTTSTALDFSDQLKASCVSSCLKWGPSIHDRFMSGVWRRRPPDRPQNTGGSRGDPSAGPANRQRPESAPMTNRSGGVGRRNEEDQHRRRRPI